MAIAKTKGFTIATKNYMTFNELKEAVSIEGVKPLFIDGQELKAEYVLSTILGRIWHSANVNKNKREADRGGVKLTIRRALALDLIDKDKALMLMLDPNKEEVGAIKALLPQEPKSEEPSEEDIELAIAQVLANKGQRA